MASERLQGHTCVVSPPAGGSVEHGKCLFLFPTEMGMVLVAWSMMDERVLTSSATAVERKEDLIGVTGLPESLS